MEKVEGNKKNKGKADGFSFLLFRIIFVLLIAVSIFAVRFLNRAAYAELKRIYDDHISVNVTADYFLSEEN